MLLADICRWLEVGKEAIKQLVVIFYSFKVRFTNLLDALSAGGEFFEAMKNDGQLEPD